MIYGRNIVGEIRTEHTPSGNPTFEGHDLSDSYAAVRDAAKHLHKRSLQAVAREAAPSTLRATLLLPLVRTLDLNLQLELLAKPDQEFMPLFAGKPGLGWMASKVLVVVYM